MELAATIAVRLADEGVPVRAIARATAIAPSVLYETLVLAKHDGAITELPRDDWPPGCPRDQRALQLARILAENHHALMLAVQVIFHVTHSQARILLALVQHETVARERERAELTSNCFDVQVHHLRKHLSTFGFKIKTLWGYGYQLGVDDRRRMMDMVLARVTLAPTL